MSKKTTKDKKPRPAPMQNRQIPLSQVRKTAVTFGVDPLLEHARDYPMYGCWVMQGWDKQGITPVVVARKQGPDRILFANYMIDLYCMGIKDVLIRTHYSLSRFERELPAFCSGAPKVCSVEFAHEMIYGAMEYAEALGFQPHPDFKRLAADQVLDPPDAHARINHISFGKDGKPLFIAGPNDNQFKISTVISTLKRTCGEGNFDVILSMDGADHLS